VTAERKTNTSRAALGGRPWRGIKASDPRPGRLHRVGLVYKDEEKRRRFKGQVSPLRAAENDSADCHVIRAYQNQLETTLARVISAE